MLTAALITVLVLAIAAVAGWRRRHPYATVVVGTAAIAVVLGVAGSAVLALTVAVRAIAIPALAGTVQVVRRSLAGGGQRAVCGSEALVGRVGIVRRPLDPVGQILVTGELWRARRSWAEEDEPPPREGEPVVVDHVHGLTLSVRRAEPWEVEG